MNVSLSGALSAVRSAPRAVRKDLLTAAVQPLPPMTGPRWARWLPYSVVLGTAMLLAKTGGQELGGRYQVGHGIADALAIVHATALVLAMRWPVPAWWLSLTTGTVTAWAAASPLRETTAPWPWTVPSLCVHAGVLGLLALRVRPRIAAEVLAGSVLVTILVKGWGSGHPFADDTLFATILFTAVVILAASVRGRREARAQLARQAALTEAERVRRTLLEERSRIARELHDVVAHHMSVVAIQAEAAPYRVQDPPQELVAGFATIRQNAVSALTELRRVLDVLRSQDTGADAPDAPQPTLADLDGLMANVRAAGVPVTATLPDKGVRLPPGVELSAFRIVQEALSNVLRHAPGAPVRVRVAGTAGGLRVAVTNDRPRTVPPPLAPPGTGHGILGMRERAAMLGGTLRAGPMPGGGWTVTAFLPVTGAEGGPGAPPRGPGEDRGGRGPAKESEGA
ncbi:sensor histidine kinase [Streptomyces capparidis]